MPSFCLFLPLLYKSIPIDKTSCGSFAGDRDGKTSTPGCYDLIWAFDLDTGAKEPPMLQGFNGPNSACGVRQQAAAAAVGGNWTQ